MVRGVGSATTTSRAGFFSTLVAFIQINVDKITFSEVFAVMEKELHVSTTLRDKVKKIKKKKFGLK